jgi:hypothetical protein
MRITGIFRALTVLALVLAFSSAAVAQPPRTWVSGVGDDANPCSRTAPCKTFAGAISKTAPGGIINVLDPGAYGIVTITKALTIQNEGLFAGVLAGGSNGIIVNAGATDSVVLRGLSLEGSGTGLNGIRFIAGLSLTVENCDINRFTLHGIDFEPAGNSLLFVKNTVIRNGNFGGGGIFIKPGAAGTAVSSLDHVFVERNTFGIEADDRSKVTVRDSEVSRNTNAGIRALSTVGGANNSVINVVDSLVAFNLGAGVRAEGTGALVRIANVSIFNNGGTGIQPTGGGVVNSFGNNNNAGNNPDGGPTAPTIPQQ